MGKTTINFGRDELVSFTTRLEKMGKYDLPIVVRQTLNNAAVNAKKYSIPEEFSKKFTQRNKSFIKSRTRFKLEKGSNISKMRSFAGIANLSDQATQDLAIQETGGIIEGRTLIPMDTARVGKSEKKQVRKSFRLRNINAYQRVKSGDQSGLMKAANVVGLGGYLIYGNTLFQIRKIVRVGSGAKKGNTFVKMIPLYSFKSGRSVRIQKKPFVRVAAVKEGKKLSSYFAQNAKRRLRK